MEFKLPNRKENSNKSTYGRVLNIAGSDYMPGAAYLSSVSALKTVCGYCYLCSTERAIDAVAAQTQNIVFVPQNKVQNYIQNADVIEAGCGLGTDIQSVKMFSKIIDNRLQNRLTRASKISIITITELQNEYFTKGRNEYEYNQNGTHHRRSR